MDEDEENERCDYLTDPERLIFENLEERCRLHLANSEVKEAKSDEVNKVLLEIASNYVTIKYKASLEELTVEERQYLGEKELPMTTIVFLCGIITKFLR